MNKVLYSCTIGEHIYGLDRVELEPLIHKHVFIQDNDDLLGFRRSNKFFVRGVDIYYEIGFFLEMLYEGDIEAYEMLNCSKEFIDYKTEEWDIIFENKSMFDTSMFTHKLLESTKRLYSDIKVKKSIVSETDKEGNKSFKKLVYDKDISYFCLRNLYLLQNSLINSELRFLVKESDILKAVDLGKFKLGTVRKEINKLFKKVDSLQDETILDTVPDHEEVDKILLRLRKEKIYYED
jgi:hypothetical protein